MRGHDFGVRHPRQGHCRNVEVDLLLGTRAHVVCRGAGQACPRNSRGGGGRPGKVVATSGHLDVRLRDSGLGHLRLHVGKRVTHRRGLVDQGSTTLGDGDVRGGGIAIRQIVVVVFLVIARFIGAVVVIVVGGTQRLRRVDLDDSDLAGAPADQIDPRHQGAQHKGQDK